MSIGANKLSLNGGAIWDQASNTPLSTQNDGISGLGLDARVTHTALDDDASHKVAAASSSLTLSGETSVNYAENGEGSVGTYTLSGAHGDITWSLSGDDSDYFSLSGASDTRKALSFASSPNYEDPADHDTDNQYSVTIQASDGTNTGILRVTVIVTNVEYDADELPVITGTAQVGQTLTVDTSPIRNAAANTDFGYVWIRTDGDTDTNIDGTSGSSSYTLTADDVGKTIKVQVGFWSTSGEIVFLKSEATTSVAKPNQAATGSPTISGAVQVGQALTASTTGIADVDGLTNATFTYQWLADDAAISGATGSSYTLAAGDQGKAIKVRVSFNDDAGNAETLTSAATAAVAPPPLTASASQVPGSHDGSSTFTFQLRFSEEPHQDFSYVTLRDHAFTVTGGSIQNARRLNPPSNVGWEITVQPSGDGTVTVVLPPTTDCEATGAVCTGDGRKLSNLTTVTVEGP